MDSKMKTLLTMIAILSSMMCVTNLHASKPSRGIKTFVLKAVDKAAMKGVEKAGLLHCPPKQQCYCTRPNKMTNYKSVCRYLDTDKVYHSVKEYDTADICLSLCKGMLASDAKENVDIRGAEEKQPVTSPNPQAPKAKLGTNCEQLPDMRGDMVNCCGTKGTVNGKRVCLS